MVHVPSAPFLLQAFAARILAAKQSDIIPTVELAKQGYDVEMLLEMISEYASLPAAERTFSVEATADEIRLARKPNSPAPVTPVISLSQHSGTSHGTAHPMPPPAQLTLAGLVKRSKDAKLERSPQRKAE